MEYLAPAFSLLFYPYPSISTPSRTIVKVGEGASRITTGKVSLTVVGRAHRLFVVVRRCDRTKMMIAEQTKRIADRPRIVVVGIGNDYRRDDAVGLLVARELER